MITKYRKFKRPSVSSLFLNSYLRIGFFLISVLVLLIAVIHLAFSNLKMNQKRTALNSRVRSLEQEIEALKDRNKQLKAQISRVSDQEYLEKEARERLNLKKPGEKVVTIVVQNKNKKDKKNLETINLQSWWQKLLERLGVMQ